MDTTKEKNAENRLLAQVTGKRKREVGLIEPAKFTAFATEFWIENVMDEW